jgi:hypothetical protein
MHSGEFTHPVVASLDIPLYASRKEGEKIFPPQAKHPGPLFINNLFYFFLYRLSQQTSFG